MQEQHGEHGYERTRGVPTPASWVITIQGCLAEESTKDTGQLALRRSPKITTALGHAHGGRSPAEGYLGILANESLALVGSFRTSVVTGEQPTDRLDCRVRPETTGQWGFLGTRNNAGRTPAKLTHKTSVLI